MNNKKQIINIITGRKMEDLTGNTYGNLTVIGVDFNKMKEEISKGRKGSFWFCKCNCDSNKIISESMGALKSGKVISCGCSRKAINKITKYKDLIGQKFGKLIVLSLNIDKTNENRIKGQRIRFWNCKCDCGNEVIVNGESLKSGKTKSCGCIFNESIQKTMTDRALNGNSVGHYITKKYGQKNFYNIWDEEKNININPFEINRGSNDIFFAKCENDKTHPSYPVSALHFCVSESRCPICNYSKGEIQIEEWLINNNFNKNKDYIPQKEFDGLLGLSGGNLSYDFYLFNYNGNDALIEYDGEWHYEGKVPYQTKKQYEKQQAHDKLKNEYCIKNKIKLLRIAYWDFDNIDQILTDYILNNKINETPEYVINASENTKPKA